MCRNIMPLLNSEPPVNNEEIHAAALQHVCKISSFNTPSRVGEAAFVAAVDKIAAASGRLLASRMTGAPPKNHEVEMDRARVDCAEGRPSSGWSHHSRRRQHGIRI